MYTCASCAIHACNQRTGEDMPANCPMRDRQLIDAALERYSEGDNRKFYVTASEMEKIGYCKWPRLRETIEFCLRMGYEKVGLAFCIGLSGEAKVVEDLLRKAGLKVVSVICKTGGVDKASAGISEDMKFSPDSFEAMCNPIAQAMLLNGQGTQFNIALGLCVGHDSLFYKYSDAMVTTLVVKDRVTGHNPAAAIYCAHSYFKKRLQSGDES